MLEDGIDFFPDSAGGPNPPPLDRPPCEVQPKVVEHDPNTMDLTLQHTLTIGQPSHHAIAVPLLPLQSNVVEFVFAAGTTSDIYVGANGTGLKYKVYLDQPQDLDGAACRNVPDGVRTISTPLPPGAKVYVLVSNTQHSGSAATVYTVSVDIPE